jgi:hypothetical protein
MSRGAERVEVLVPVQKAVEEMALVAGFTSVVAQFLWSVTRSRSIR